MDGWPEGWACFGAGGPNERFVSAGDRYVLYGEREGCRRAAWAIDGKVLDRGALARIEELERANAALTATANAAVARAEEAQLRARQAEEERDVLRDYDSPFEADAENLRAEVQRLRRALDRTAQGAAYLTDALSELTGGDHA